MKMPTNKHPIVLMLVLTGTLAISTAGCETLERAATKIKKFKNNITATVQTKAAAVSFDSRDLRFARQQFDLQQYEAAEYYLKKTLMLDPEDPEALALLPWVYFYQKRYDKALLAFEQTLVFDPRNVEALTGSGWCRYALQNYEGAWENFTLAERGGKNLFQIHKGKGFVHLAQGRSVQAAEEFLNIYSPGEIKIILGLWNRHRKESPLVLPALLPSSPDSLSLFGLPVEHPRYRSVLLDPIRTQDPLLDKAWKHFNNQSYKRALELFASRGGSVDAGNGAAWCYLMTGQIMEAENRFREIIRTHPKFMGAVKGLAKVEEEKAAKLARVNFYTDRGKFSIAEKKFKVLAEKFPGWPAPLVQLGNVELARDQAGAARDYFLEALQLAPNHPPAVAGQEKAQKILVYDLYRADRALKAGNYKLASQIYFDYIQEHPDDSNEFLAHAYNRLGWSQYQKGQYILAIEKFQHAQSHQDYYLDSIKGQGFSYFQTANFSQAIPLLRTVHQAHPEDHEIAGKLDMSILKSWNPDRSQTYFEQALLQNPLRGSLYVGMGWIHYKKNKPDLAVEYFLKAISLDPDFALDDEFVQMLNNERFGWQVYNRLGWTHYHKGNYSKSMTMFQIALKDQPNKSEARKGMGYNLFQLKKYGEAKTFLEGCLAINPYPNPVLEKVADKDNTTEIETTPRTKLGRIYFLQNDYKKAITEYRQELSLNLNQAEAYDGLGWAYLKTNQLTEARAAFTTAIRLRPLNPLPQKGLSQVKHLVALRNTQKIKPLSLSRLKTSTSEKISPAR